MAAAKVTVAKVPVHQKLLEALILLGCREEFNRSVVFRVFRHDAAFNR